MTVVIMIMMGSMSFSFLVEETLVSYLLIRGIFLTHPLFLQDLSW